MNARPDTPPAGPRTALALALASPALLQRGSLFGDLQGDWIGIALIIVLLIVCLGIHEAAHAWVAWKCGDTTARDLGRLTLNPIAHVDLFMTIILPAILISTRGFIFGGAKPVPVDFHRLRNPWRDMSLVAFAGPLSNFLLAILFAVARHFLIRTGFYNDAAATEFARQSDRLPSIMQAAVGFNVILAVFNMVPIPPLDGSRIMAYALPASLRPSYISLERFGLMIVMVLIFFVPGFQMLLGRWMYAVTQAVEWIATLGGAW